MRYQRESLHNLSWERFAKVVGVNYRTVGRYFHNEGVTKVSENKIEMGIRTIEKYQLQFPNMKLICGFYWSPDDYAYKETDIKVSLFRALLEAEYALKEEG